MKQTFWLAIFLALGLAPSPTLAQQASFASQADLALALERQDARLEELEHALAERQQSAPCDDGCCGDACGDCLGGACDPCCRSGGVIGGAELAFLKPHTSGGMRGMRTDIDFGYDIAQRYWFGYQGADGLGWRVRYWEFDHQKNRPIGDNVVDSIDYDAYTLDLELFDSMNLGCYWDLSFWGGFRYVEFDQERLTFIANNGTHLEGNQFQNSSIGLTVGGELRRAMGCNVAGFLNTRASVLMGDEDETQITGGVWTLADRELDNVYYIWESQAGTQWTQELDGGYLYVRAAVEVQIWENFAGNNEDWGLGGFSLSAGLIR